MHAAIKALALLILVLGTTAWFWQWARMNQRIGRWGFALAALAFVAQLVFFWFLYPDLFDFVYYWD